MKKAMENPSNKDKESAVNYRSTRCIIEDRECTFIAKVQNFDKDGAIWIRDNLN